MIAIPHKCTRCEKIFKDGAAEILSGCPACGWNKFLYVRDEVEKPAPKTPAEETPIETIDETTTEPAHERFIREVDELQETGFGEDRVESVRILGPGSYELDLEGLLERREIIMALKEDGTYVVHLPSVFEKSSLKKKRR